MQHKTAIALISLSVCVLLAACGGSIEPQPEKTETRTAGTTAADPSGTTSSGGGSSSSGSASGSGSVTPTTTCGLVEAASLDKSCETDADCVAVPEGGNTCDPCNPGDGVWGCALVAINVQGQAAYQAALQAGLAPYRDDPKYESCIVTSCPTAPTVSCVAKVCQ